MKRLGYRFDRLGEMVRGWVRVSHISHKARDMGHSSICLGLRLASATALLLGTLAWTAYAQNATPDVYTQDGLAAMERTLAAKADDSGLATEALRKYASDFTLLAFRNQSGKAELHEKFADFYFVVEGKATLVSGGQMVDGKTTAPGEVRAGSIKDGKETTLKKGDIAHIPANIPHQLLLSKGDTFQYFVVKVQEKD